MVKQPAGGYSVQVGNVLVTSFTDGSVAQDLHTLLRRTTAQKTDALLAKNFQANPVEASINAFLIALPGHKILVDTGSGQLLSGQRRAFNREPGHAGDQTAGHHGNLTDARAFRSFRWPDKGR